MRSNRPGLGIGLMVASGMMLTASDAATKLLTENIPAAEVLLSKSLLTVTLFLLFAPVIGPRRIFRVQRWQGQMLRAVLSVASTFLFVFGLKVLPLSTAAMLSFASPLFVTVLAPWLLSEHSDAHRWAAVVAGFSGVAIIISPATGDVSYVMLLPLGAALCAALRDILTRTMAEHETTESMVFYSLVGVSIAGLFASCCSLTLFTFQEWWLIAVAAVTNVAALYLMVEAVRNAEAATVAPFKYCNLLWVTVFEFTIWAQLPAWNVILGAGVIVAAMLYILYGTKGRQDAPARATLDHAVGLPTSSDSPLPSERGNPVGHGGA